MAAEFRGTVGIDIRDSEPDWAPFEPPKAPPGARTSSTSCSTTSASRPCPATAGPIDTPNIDRDRRRRGALHPVAHDRALLADALLPADRPQPHPQQHGLHHRGRDRLPQRERHHPARERDAVRDPRRAGWNTYIVGKWHLCPDDEMNLASTRRNWPSGRGFERWYGFLGAETNQWYPELVYDNHPVDQPSSPEEGYHFSVDITDKALEFIRDAKAIAPEKPFFLYYAPGAAHAPHHAPKEWADRYAGRFDMGYEAMREETLARQKAMGIVPADTELPADEPDRHAGDPHRSRRRSRSRRWT